MQQPTLEINSMPSFSFAMQQNRIPLIRSIVFKNETEKEIDNVVVYLSFEPETVLPSAFDIPVCEAFSSAEISPIETDIPVETLFSLTEKLSGSINVKAVREGEVIAEKTVPLDILAYDQWPGYNVSPELVCAFITPNHPKISEVVSKAAVYLQKWCGSPSFTGYQSGDPNTVKLQAAALFSALTDLGTAYIVPPASYEKSGQRIRLPETVITEKHGTCLDLTLLYCACLEAVGLGGAVIFTKGHAFAGVWLDDKTFPYCAEYDVSALTKRAASGIDEFIAVECTDLTMGKSAGFEDALKHAALNLSSPEEFILAVDVRRSRRSGIRPIPSRSFENGEFSAADYGKPDKSRTETAPDEIDTARRGVVVSDKQLTKLEIWERGLLDLSLRNSLLNFRLGASSMKIMHPKPAEIEDALSDGKEFLLLPRPETSGDELILSEFAGKRLFTYLDENDLEKTLKKTQRLAKTGIEENGANTLYLAVGFLRWYETDKSEKPRYAPLVLVPAELIRKRNSEKYYTLRARGEETVMNITLLELLRQDHGINVNGLDPLPLDDHGVDIPLVFSTIRNAVMGKKRWDIEEYACLGQFSFGRFVMWNDLRARSGELTANKIVNALVTGVYAADGAGTAAESAGSSVNTADGTDSAAESALPSDTALTMSADSSQLEAVIKAAKGESFVLHGPPGTGKSQTITNMISNALFHGKTVLFAAEKMAALSVVKTRLEKVGLGAFCLELHSNKAHKRDVLNQLEAALTLEKQAPPEGWKKAADDLHEMRTNLDGTMSALFKERCAGMSVYDAAVKYLTVKELDGNIKLGAEAVLAADAGKASAMLEAVSDAASTAEELGGAASCPLRDVRLTDYSMQKRDEFRSLTLEASEKAGAARESMNAVNEALGVPLPLDCLTAATAAAGSKDIVKELLTCDLPSDTYSDLLAEGWSYTTKKSSILSEFEPTALDYDCGTALVEVKKARQSKLFGGFALSKQIKALSLHAKDPKLVDKKNIEMILLEIGEIKRLREKLAKTEPPLLGGLWKGEDTDFTALSERINKSLVLRDELKAADEPLRALLAQKAGDGGLYSLLLTAGKNLKAYETLKAKLGNDFRAPLPGELSEAAETAEKWSENADILRDRAALEIRLEKLRSLGIPEAADALLSGEVSEARLKDAFVCALCRVILDSFIPNEPLLSRFRGTDLDKTAERFRSLTSEFEKLTSKELTARLAERLPDLKSGGASQGGELAVLQRAIKSGGRGVSIRKLFGTIPNLLTRLCPCMLMSPMSAAQYIDPSYRKFDIVIFDEASQLPTSEAVGAIARGNNAVIVGDPKQLPPTSFFSVTRSSEDEDEAQKEDLESVLDDCLAVSLPQRSLLWHYRSRHESLIAFSNMKFYGGSLRTFPSPDDLVSRVELVHTDGFYDMGGTKQNVGEARAVTAEIVRRLRDPLLKKESIGVVTFNIIQQELIDDMLSAELGRDPALDRAAAEMYEPILIKNLENVQGDERDVILFSVGYGPDKNGRVSMNFGPINRDGGQRRLNVAVSRARKRMIVFSTLRPEQIDLSRTRSEGAAGLKAFLEFAQKGSCALSVDATVIKRSAQSRQGISALAKIAAKRIEAMGYGVRTDIGTSAFRVDIGVIDPDDEGRYILGIICDSAAGDVRDRHIVQPSVLEGLGWDMLHIYALDLLDDSEKEYRRIEAAIAAAVEKRRKAAELSRLEATEGSEPSASENSDTQTEAVSPVSEIPDIQAEAASPAPEFSENSGTATKATAQQSAFTEYVRYRPDTFGDKDSFFDSSSNALIKRVITLAVNAEAPVSEDRIYTLVLEAFGITKKTIKARNRFNAVFSEMMFVTTRTENNRFIWKYRQVPEEYESFRVPSGDYKRSPADIPAEEYAAAVIYILKSAVASDKTALCRDVSRLFGTLRLGGGQEAVLLGIELCERAGRIRLEGEKVVFVN